MTMARPVRETFRSKQVPSKSQIPPELGMIISPVSKRPMCFATPQPVTCTDRNSIPCQVKHFYLQITIIIIIIFILFGPNDFSPRVQCPLTYFFIPLECTGAEEANLFANDNVEGCDIIAFVKKNAIAFEDIAGESSHKVVPDGPVRI